MQDHIFRKGDIRGIVGTELLIEEVYSFGRALAAYYKQRKPNFKTVVIGMDGRIHSPKLQDHLIRAFVESGIDVQLLGLCPTPLIYFVLHTMLIDGCVMITASHNEKEYNGFKICLGKELLDAVALQHLKALYNSKVEHVSEKKGSITEILLVGTYCDYMVQQFSHLKNNKMSFIIDCVGGAAAVVMPLLVEKMGWSNVQLRNIIIDGEFKNALPDPTKRGALDGLSAHVVACGAEIGFAFDGDGDRLVVITHEGQALTGDMLLTLFSEQVLKNSSGGTIVFDSKCSQVLASMIEQWGGHGVMSATGHSFVKQKMVETGALLAGELSCHVMFKDRYFGCDDAIYALLRVLEILDEKKMSLKNLIERFPKSYTTGEVRIPCAEEQKEYIVEQVKCYFEQRSVFELLLNDGVRATAEYGWGIVRVSNTQPVISFSCESLSPEGFERIKDEFKEALEKAFKGEKVCV